MTPAYSSFLVRYWTMDGGAARIEVEHIQSRARTRVASPAAALAWLRARAGDAPADADAMTGPGDPAGPDSRVPGHGSRPGGMTDETPTE
jgi:hypothetical protein